MEEEVSGGRGKWYAIAVITIIVVAVVVYFSVFKPKTQENQGSTPPSGAFMVYSEAGIPSGSDIYTWDSYRTWQVGSGEATFNGEYTGETPPEGTKCFLTSSNNGNTYAGWGIFLIRPSDHTVDLSRYNALKFSVKTSTNLKIEIQQTDASGRKSARYIGQHGWNGTDTWQEITIPADSFTGVDMGQVWGVFSVTVESSDKTFYIDYVRWE